MREVIENRIIERFEGEDSFSREELRNFFLQSEPGLKEATFTWRIHHLTNKNLIKPIKRGIYSLTSKPAFQPEPSPELWKIARKIQEKFAGTEYCLWDTTWLNEFLQHQTSQNFIIVEIEKELSESLFFYLKDAFPKLDLFLNPDQKVIDYYLSESKKAVVIKNLTSRSPLSCLREKKTILCFPVLEKILTDVYSDRKLFYFFQGSELNAIFENALSRYSLNFTRLLSYAGRREKGAKLKNYLKEHNEDLAKDILND
ncbi:MAG: hypothetical protein H6581_05160 [Bacteroidia bacterium]|nr:hypothetical protein [Bacteroidia bacterium]